MPPSVALQRRPYCSPRIRWSCHIASQHLRSYEKSLPSPSPLGGEGSAQRRVRGSQTNFSEQGTAEQVAEKQLFVAKNG